MFLVISNANGWAAAVNEYNISVLQTPNSYPVLIAFQKPEEGETIGEIDMLDVSTAIAFINASSNEGLMKVPFDRLSSLKLKLNKVLSSSSVVPKIPSKSTYVSLSVEDGVSTKEWTASGQFQVGDAVNIDGEKHVITGVVGEDVEQFVGMDPITGEEGLMTVGAVPMPGLAGLPVDASKVQPKAHIANLGDPQEHVLDEERAV